jgi:hypothetical protein
MTCDLCQKTPRVDEGVVTVTIGDFTQHYCGTPSPGSEMSCWQEAIRGWYWVLSHPVALKEEQRRAPSVGRMREGGQGKANGRVALTQPRLAFAKGQVIVH